MMRTKTTMRQQLTEDAEDAVEAACNHFEAVSAEHSEAAYRERELAAKVAKAEALIEQAEKVRRALRSGEPLPVIEALYPTLFDDLKNDRPAVDGMGGQTPGSSPNARTTE